MAGQLSQLHDYIDEKNVKAVNYLTGTVTDTFVKIAGICKVNTEPVYDFESDSIEANEDSYPEDDDDEEILKPPAKKGKSRAKLKRTLVIARKVPTPMKTETQTTTKKRLKMANNRAKKERRKERTTKTENKTMNCLTFPL